MDVCIYIKEIFIVSYFIVVFNLNCSDLFTVPGFHFKDLECFACVSLSQQCEGTLGLLRCSTRRIMLQFY